MPRSGRRSVNSTTPTRGAVRPVFRPGLPTAGCRCTPTRRRRCWRSSPTANVIVATPTGSGKSLIATAALFTGLATGRRSYYTAPIKALVSEKFFDLVDIFGASAVGMITGDSAVNAAAPIICCTAEILAGIALRGGDRLRRRHGGDGRVPLLRRPAARLGLAGAAARTRTGPSSC